MKYGIIGAAGYIAPRHMDAITHAGGEIVVACDTHDSVGVLDRYAPRARFHTRDDRFFHDLDDVDVIVVCSTNHRHRQHARLALASSCRVVLEKPAGISTDDIASLSSAPFAHQMITPVAQLRYHEGVQRLRDAAQSYRVAEIRYRVYRGAWYDKSWKTDPSRSGGLMLNLGVHLVDLCLHIFGPLKEVHSVKHGETSIVGSFECERGRVVFELERKAEIQERTISIGHESVDLSEGMDGLHRRIYEDLEQGRQVCTLQEALDAVRACIQIQEFGAKEVAA